MQSRVKMAEEAMFELFTLFAGLAVAQAPAVGRIQKEHVDRAGRDLAIQGIALQQLPYFLPCQGGTLDVVLDPVTGGKRKALAPGKIDQGIATAAAGVEEFQGLLAGSEQVINAA